MSYTVDIIYSKNADYTDPQTVTETGQPLSIELTNLDTDTTYFVKAVLKNNNVVESEDTEKFTTLSAGETECFYVKNTSDSTGTFTISENVVANNIQYYDPSTNNWWWVTTVPKTISVESGEKLYLRGGSSLVVTSGADVQHFTMDVDHEIGGDIRSLLNWYDFQSNQKGVSTVTEIPDKAFWALFYQDTLLTDASKVIFGNVTTGEQSLYTMFYGDISLKGAPDMSEITSLGKTCCHKMFMGCSSLTTPADMPNLTITKSVSCHSMYRQTGVTRVADMHNVSEFGEWTCQEMYRGCTSLTSTTNYPIINSIGVWGTHCGMFQECTSLVNPPDTSTITKLDDVTFNSFLKGCTSLTTGCDLRNVTSIRGNNNEMYNGCTSLTEVYAPNISTWDTSLFSDWLNNVADTGVVHKPAKLTIPTDDVSGVPTGWTTQDY